MSRQFCHISPSRSQDHHENRSMRWRKIVRSHPQNSPSCTLSRTVRRGPQPRAQQHQKPSHRSHQLSSIIHESVVSQDRCVPRSDAPVERRLHATYSRYSPPTSHHSPSGLINQHQTDTPLGRLYKPAQSCPIVRTARATRVLLRA